MGHPAEDRPPGTTGRSSQDHATSSIAPGASNSTTSHQLEKTLSQGKDNSGDTLPPSGEEERSRSSNKKSSDRQRICGKCQRSLTGQFVRALGDTYHLECFTCHDCGKIVASKFFPVPDHPPGQYPLCETDYFRRLDLLCFACGGALRGSYITALERKYHIEHFTCSVCPTVFGAQDSYYEHESRVYCHYHYSTRFAQKCNGCQTAILKQFVEIFRNGQDQHWHPECYMIHKYWNVRLHAPPPKGVIEDAHQKIETTDEDREDGDASEASRKQVRDEEEAVEYKVHWIWQTLSSFEERSATCISDMLLHVSNGAYMEGVVAARKFITHVDLLFTAADDLDRQLQHRAPIQRNEKNVRSFEAIVHPGLSYSREAKLLCKKVVAFFQLLTEKQDIGVRRLGVTQELLSLVTGLAHYLKLMIRICLSGALRLERETSSAVGLEIFLQDIGSLDERLEAESQRDFNSNTEPLIPKSADTCANCNKSVEDKCIRHGARVFHIQCLTCCKCGKELGNDLATAYYSESQAKEFCETHAPLDSHGGENIFVYFSRLQQYTLLLRIAHARLLANLQSSGTLPHTSDDPNLGIYDSQNRTGGDGDHLALRSNTRSQSHTGHSSHPEDVDYEDTMVNIRRLRSTRLGRQLSSAVRHTRTSRIIDGPEGMRPGSTDGEEAKKEGKRRTSSFQIVEDHDTNGEPNSQLTFGNHDTMTLDDIPRLVQAQQTREQRPNASRFARQPMIPQEPRPRFINGHNREASGHLDDRIERPAGTKKYFSELTALEYFIVRHVAVLSMEPLLEGYFNQEELLDLIEGKPKSWWGRVGKALQGKEKKPKSAKTAVFGVPLEQLLERDYEESTDGVGPGSLKVPSLIQEALSAMKTMDMSVEGVFRKNGNIKRLNDLKDDIDSKGTVEADLTKETPVQVAALLKKFLRELPDPLLTYKLHRLWITTQKLEDPERRRRVLHLTCCLLPKTHRDVMEVLFAFMTWVASFSHVDEESGSKMDIHNLATVITPNILHKNNEIIKDVKGAGLDESFLAIEAIHSLIECNESMCEVPEDLALILNDSTLFSGSADITTKEILRRYGDRAKAPTINTNHPPQAINGHVPSSSHGASGPANNSLAMRVDRDPHMQNAWSNESSVRHVGQEIGGTTPPNPPYAQPRHSSDSHGSPSRASNRQMMNDKQQQQRALGMT